MSKFVEVIRPVMEKFVDEKELSHVYLDGRDNVMIEFKDNVVKEHSLTEKLRCAVVDALKANGIAFRGICMIQRKYT